MRRYGTHEELTFIDSVAPFAREAAAEGPGTLEQFISFNFLRYIHRFPRPDPEGHNFWDPEGEAAFRSREREFIMDLFHGIAWECHTCAQISLPVTWNEYIERSSEREEIDRNIRTQYEQLRLRRASEERRRAEEEAERVRLENEEDLRRWKEWAQGLKPQTPAPPAQVPAPPSPGSSIETPIVIDE